MWPGVINLGGKKKKGRTLTKRKMTSEEKQYCDKICEAEKEKYERDLQAGGISPEGHYIRLHDRRL